MSDLTPAAYPSRVLLSQTIPGRLAREERLLADYANKAGIPVGFGSESMMERGRIALDRSVLVAGSVRFVLHALRRLGLASPLHMPYPAALSAWLHRRVARYERLRDALAYIRDSGQPMFIKPAKGWKRFTGFVIQHPDDPRLIGISKNLPVWISQPISLVSEWRAYVAHGSVLAIKFVDHGGDRRMMPDVISIQEAVAKLVDARQAPAGFVIDFGVDIDGRTILVEVNDGFSFGAYDDLDSNTYWTVTVARWYELVGAVNVTNRTQGN